MKILLPQQYQAVTNVVCGHFEVTAKELNSKLRTNRIAQTRHVIWYLLRAFGFDNNSEIARVAGKDHGTVRFGIMRCCDLITVDPEFARTVSFLESRCKLLLEAK